MARSSSMFYIFYSHSVKDPHTKQNGLGLLNTYCSVFLTDCIIFGEINAVRILFSGALI